MANKTIPGLPVTWTPFNIPIDAYKEAGSASQPAGLGSARMLAAWNNLKSYAAMAYGAKFDNATNDTAALQACIDAAVSAGGGNVLLPPGTALIDGVTIRGDNVKIWGLGSHVTKLKRRAGSASANVLELGDTAAGNSATAYEKLEVHGVSVDGNKANVAQPTTDLTDWGVPLTKISYAVLDDVRAYDCWNGGFLIAINSNYANAKSCYVKNCGIGGNTGTGEEPGFDINSSKYGIFDVTSEACRYGARVLDNCFGNQCRFVIKSAQLTGLVLGNQTVNESYGNIINATIIGGCSDQGMSFGTNWNDNHMVIVADGLTGRAVRDVGNATYPSHGNTIVVNSRLCALNSCQIENASNQWFVCSTDDGTSGSPVDYFAVEVMTAVAVNNLLYVTVRDTRGTPRLRGVVFQTNTSGNRLVAASFTNCVQNYSDVDEANFWNDRPFAWTDATFAAGWSNAYGAPSPAVGYGKDYAKGIVYLRGNAQGSATGTIFTLPAGFRPSADLIFPAVSPNDQGAQVLTVKTTGVVELIVCAGAKITPLSQIIFPIV